MKQFTGSRNVRRNILRWYWKGNLCTVKGCYPITLVVFDAYEKCSTRSVIYLDDEIYCYGRQSLGAFGIELSDCWVYLRVYILLFLFHSVNRCCILSMPLWILVTLIFLQYLKVLIQMVWISIPVQKSQLLSSHK